ncbi:hypothetical protein Bbelb_375900 [Branchiostoma belcheri]|nr:hypothetical protein Bbelb_375900 [Branchiostoma belcheri]
MNLNPPDEHLRTAQSLQAAAHKTRSLIAEDGTAAHRGFWLNLNWKDELEWGLRPSDTLDLKHSCLAGSSCTEKVGGCEQDDVPNFLSNGDRTIMVVSSNKDSPTVLPCLYLIKRAWNRPNSSNSCGKHRECYYRRPDNQDICLQYLCYQTTA